MTPLDALLDLLERVGAGNGAALVSGEELSHWPAEAVRALQSRELLVRASPAASVVCPGCEQQCTMPVHTVSAGTGKAASFAVCDKRDDIHHVPISAERLKQWRCNVEAVGAFVANSLGLRLENRRKIGDGLWELGLVRGRKRSQMLCLRANEALEVVAGNSALPLTELVGFGPEGCSLDVKAVRQLVDVATTGDPRYTPSNARREARKLETQSLHETWRKEYRALKKRRPGMSDTWYSRQIAGNAVGKNRRAETIRKHMKR